MPILNENSLEFISLSPDQTRRIGLRLGTILEKGDVICLCGELGAGKTTLMQGIAQGWGSGDAVTSPTFVLVNNYRRPDGAEMYHLDAYRLQDARDAEVLDLDEAAYREDHIVTRLYGYLTIPYRREYVQNHKVPTPAGDSVQAQAIAAEVIERMRPDRAYLLGPGTTTRAVTERLGLPSTLVGVDIISRNEVLSMDVGERQILEMLKKHPLGMIVTPTGGQGFLFGRGNQPLSPEVIRRVSPDDILVISPMSKIAALRGQPLRVDSGDPEVDSLLSGHIEVITGYREKIIYRVSA